MQPTDPTAPRAPTTGHPATGLRAAVLQERLARAVADTDPDGAVRLVSGVLGGALAAACRAHQEQAALLLEPIALEAAVVARAARAAGQGLDAARDACADLVPRAAADLVARAPGPPGPQAHAAARRLGVGPAAAARVLHDLHSYRDTERRILRLVLVEGLSPAACGARTGERPGTVAAMLSLVQRYAVDVQRALDDAR